MPSSIGVFFSSFGFNRSTLLMNAAEFFDFPRVCVVVRLYVGLVSLEVASEGAVFVLLHACMCSPGCSSLMGLSTEFMPLYLFYKCCEKQTSGTP